MFKKVLFIYFILISLPTFSNVINEVIITGNEKSKKESIVKWAGIRIGKELTDKEYAEVLENLRRAYQFNILKLEFKDGVLYLDIEEKWSFFPVPMVSKSGNGYSRGLLLYENNFLGRLGTIAAGAFWTNSGLNGILYWQENNVIAQDIGLKVLLLHKSSLTEFQRGGNVVDPFETRFDTVIITPNYESGRHDHKLGPIYLQKDVYETPGNPTYSSENYGLYYRHHYSYYEKLPILFDGFQTTYDLFVLTSKNEDLDYMHAGNIEYCKPHSKNFFKAKVHFNHSDNSGYLYPKLLGGNSGYRGYDKESLPAQSNIGFLIEEQIHLWKSIYSSPFYEYNYTKLIDPVMSGERLSESAIGVNFSYYFRSISIPAVVFEYARNLDDSSSHIHINIGLSL